MKSSQFEDPARSQSRPKAQAVLTGFEISTTQEQGWSDLSNGELISIAEQSGFDILLTADSNVGHQQNLTGKRIAILILRAPNNRLATHVEMTADILAALNELKPTTVVEVFYVKR